MMWAWPRGRMSTECGYHCGTVGPRRNKQKSYRNKKDDLPSSIMPFQSSLLKEKKASPRVHCEGGLLSGSGCIVPDEIMKDMLGFERR